MTSSWGQDNLQPENYQIFKTMKKFILLIMLAVSHCANSQEINSEKDLNALMESLTPEQKDSVQALQMLFMETMEKNLRLQQVHNIGGIPFGISREDALSRLRNKYGEPEYNPQSTVGSANLFLSIAVR